MTGTCRGEDRQFSLSVQTVSCLDYPVVSISLAAAGMKDPCMSLAKTVLGDKWVKDANASIVVLY